MCCLPSVQTFDTASILSNQFCNAWFLCSTSYTSLPYSAIQLSSANGSSMEGPSGYEEISRKYYIDWDFPVADEYRLR